MDTQSLRNFANENAGLAGDVGLRAGVNAISGGAGAAARRVAQAATEESVDRAAQKIAARFATQDEVEPAVPHKKMIGWVFGVILCITIFKDLSDIFADMSVVLSMITPITTVFIALILAVYYYVNKVEVSANKMAMYMISLVLEFVPFLNAIPTTTIVLLLTKSIENKKIARQIRRSRGELDEEPQSGVAAGTRRLLGIA